MTDRRPDLVLVMTDQQRHDQVGYVGATPVRTPVLDRLAADGIVFTDAYSGSTTCVPSRTSLMTGLFDHRVPQVGRGEMEQGTFTVPHALRAAGYQTALVGKMHFTPIRADHGFEVMRVCEHLNAFAEPPEAMAELDHYHDWLRSEGLADWRFEVAGLDPRRYPYATATHPTSWVRDQALDVLSARDPERPLFLVVSFPHPHPPVNPPDEYAAAYDPAGCEVDPGSDAVNARLPAPFREALAQADAPHRRVHAASLDRHREDLARTYALITQIDEAVGVVLDRIDLDRTVLFFTSDHGDYAGRRGITVIPEIDLPGHTNAALHAIPELNCDGVAPEPYTGTQVGFSTLCIGDPAVEEFVRTVLAELAEMTPGPYIHIGGDEAHSTTTADYQAFIARTLDVVRDLGKVPVGWEEVGTVPGSGELVAQHWLDASIAEAAVAGGASLVLSPSSVLYFDMAYGEFAPDGNSC